MLTGFQFTLACADLEVLDLKAGIADLNSEDYAVMGNYTTVSWYTVSPISVKPGDILFTIVAKAKATENVRTTLSINSGITNAEAYDENNKVFMPKLEFSDPMEDRLILYSNVPNPWNEKTIIAFYMPKASKINLNVYSTSGQVQYSLERDFEAGQHEIVLNKKDFTQRGLMVYTLQSNQEVKIGKMIVGE